MCHSYSEEKYSESNRNSNGLNLLSKQNKILFFFFFFFPIILHLQQREIIAYYPGVFSENHKASEKILEEKGIFDKVTVLNYSFAHPLPDSLGRINPVLTNSYFAYQEYYSSETSVDGIADDSLQALRGQFNQLKKIKSLHPHLKILLSFGGWGGSKYFSNLALTKESREYFVNNCIDLYIKGNLPEINGAGGEGSAFGVFDGIDLDWEFPIEGGPDGTNYNSNDRENQTELFKLFRKKLDEVNPNLLLTTAVSGRAYEFWLYNFNEDQKYLDWFNVMSYDLHGIADSITGHHTNLLSSPFDPDVHKESMDRAVKYLIDTAGVDPYKIAPGAAFYGKGWINVDTSNNGLYQSGNGMNHWGYIKFDNYLDYSMVKEKGFHLFWDDYSLAAFLFNPEEKIFWTFDDIRSIVLKTRYVDAYNLRGLMFWQIFGDDSLNTFINAINNKNMPDVNFDSVSINEYLPKINIIVLNDKDLFSGSNIIFKPILERFSNVSKIEYFVDGNSIGYNTFFPFTWAWFNSTKGQHLAYCEVYNNLGEKNISEILSFYVK